MEIDLCDDDEGPAEPSGGGCDYWASAGEKVSFFDSLDQRLIEARKAKKLKEKEEKQREEKQRMLERSREANPDSIRGSSSRQGAREVITIPDVEEVQHIIVLDSDGEEDEKRSPRTGLIRTDDQTIENGPAAVAPKNVTRKYSGLTSNFQCLRIVPQHPQAQDAATSSLGKRSRSPSRTQESPPVTPPDENFRVVTPPIDASRVPLHQIHGGHSPTLADFQYGEQAKVSKKVCSLCKESGHNKVTCKSNHQKGTCKKSRVSPDSDEGKVVEGLVREKDGTGVPDEDRRRYGMHKGAVANVKEEDRRRPAVETDVLWEKSSEKDVLSVMTKQKGVDFPHGKLWRVLKHESRSNRVPPRSVVSAMVESLLLESNEMKKRLCNNQQGFDDEDRRGGNQVKMYEHAALLYSGLCDLIPGAGRWLDVNAVELCNHFQVALKQVTTGAVLDSGGKFFRHRNFQFLRFIGAVSSSDRNCVTTGVLRAGEHLLVTGVAYDSLCPMLKSIYDAAEACKKPDELEVLQDLLGGLIAANLKCSENRQEKMRDELKRLVNMGAETKVGGGLKCVGGACLQSPEWCLEWLLQVLSDTMRKGRYLPTWEGVIKPFMVNWIEGEDAVKEEVKLLFLKVTVVRVAAKCLRGDKAPTVEQRDKLRRLVDARGVTSDAGLGQRAGIEDLRWAADAALGMCICK